MLTDKNIFSALLDNDEAFGLVARELKTSPGELANFLRAAVCKSTKAIIHVDGGARGNPGEAGAGVVFAMNQKKTGYYFYLGTVTNNIAEYTGLLNSLKLAVAEKAREVIVYSDSELVCKQINGEYKVKNPGLQKIYRQCLQLIDRIDSFRIQHVPRAKNREADRLANKAMDLKKNGKIELSVAGFTG